MFFSLSFLMFFFFILFLFLFIFVLFLFCIHPTSILEKKSFFLFFLSQYHYSLEHSIFLFSVCFFLCLIKDNNNIYLPVGAANRCVTRHLSAALSSYLHDFDFNYNRHLRRQRFFQTHPCGSYGTHCTS